MSSSGPASSGEVPTVLVKDRDGRDLLCFLEQLIPLDGTDYALLTRWIHRLLVPLAGWRRSRTDRQHHQQ